LEDAHWGGVVFAFFMFVFDFEVVLVELLRKGAARLCQASK